MNCEHYLPITECPDCGPRIRRVLDLAEQYKEIDALRLERDSLKASNAKLLSEMEKVGMDSYLEGYRSAISALTASVATIEESIRQRLAAKAPHPAKGGTP